MPQETVPDWGVQHHQERRLLCLDGKPLYNEKDGKPTCSNKHSWLTCSSTQLQLMHPGPSVKRHHHNEQRDSLVLALS